MPQFPTYKVRLETVTYIWINTFRWMPSGVNSTEASAAIIPGSSERSRKVRPVCAAHWDLTRGQHSAQDTTGLQYTLAEVLLPLKDKIINIGFRWEDLKIMSANKASPGKWKPYRLEEQWLGTTISKKLWTQGTGHWRQVSKSEFCALSWHFPPLGPWCQLIRTVGWLSHFRKIW